jgi:aminopeptidase N
VTGGPVPAAHPGTVTASEAAGRAEMVSAVRYTVALDLTRGPESFGCRATIRFHSSGGSTFLDYAGTLERAECNGAPLRTDRDGRVFLPVREGENIVVLDGTASYSRVGAGLHRFQDPVDGQVYVHTTFEPFDAHRVYPCFDQPDIKASWELSVTVPDEWLVVSNTDLIGPRTPAGAGRMRWTFPPTPPLPPYLTALAAGPFRRLYRAHRGIRLGLYAREALFGDLAVDSAELFGLTQTGLDFYAGLFGQPYPFGKYDQVFVPEYAFGAMEHPGCVTINERFVFRSRVTRDARRNRAGLMLHEMAHMWFGDLVTMRWWDDLWLNEGFATLLSAIARDEATDFGPALLAFVHQAAPVARHADRLPTSHPVSSDTPDTDAARLNFDPITYKKGAAVLLQLVGHLGRDTFLAGVRDYLREHAWSNADLADLLGALQRVSGADLNEWGDQWLRRPGVNTVEVRRSASGITIGQRPEKARRLRLRVGWYTATEAGLRRGGERDIELTADSPEWTTEDASSVVLPNQDGVGYARIKLDPASRKEILASLSTMDDAMARVVAWSALWDDVIDARLPARRFVSAVLAHASREDDIGVRESLWMRAIQAATEFGCRSHVVPALASVSAKVRSALDDAEPGSDSQLVLVRVLAASGLEDDLGPLTALAGGDSPWPGLPVDSDLRWRVLSRMAVHGAATDELIDALLAEFPGEAAYREALRVRATRPDPGSKETAWALLFVPELSLAARRSIMTGLMQPGQEDLLTPYVDRYFAALRELWDTAGPEMALSFAHALYPRITTAEEYVLTRTETEITGQRLPREMLRVLREQKAELMLGRAARSCDARQEEQ